MGPRGVIYFFIAIFISLLAKVMIFCGYVGEEVLESWRRGKENVSDSEDLPPKRTKAPIGENEWSDSRVKKKSIIAATDIRGCFPMRENTSRRNEAFDKGKKSSSSNTKKSILGKENLLSTTRNERQHNDKSVEEVKRRSRYEDRWIEKSVSYDCEKIRKEHFWNNLELFLEYHPRIILIVSIILDVVVFLKTLSRVFLKREKSSPSKQNIFVQEEQVLVQDFISPTQAFIPPTQSLDPACAIHIADRNLTPRRKPLGKIKNLRPWR